MNRVIPSIFIFFIAMLVLGATLAYFSDIETSTGDTFKAGTLDLKLAHPPTPIVITESPIVTSTYRLHPIAGIDATNRVHDLSDNDLKDLSNSDDRRYESKGGWDTSFNDNEYIKFLFPKIPSTATVVSVKIKIEWARQEKVNGARLKIYDGTDWKIYTLTLAPAPGERERWGNDIIEEIDISDFINTAEKFNSLIVLFQATVSGSGDGKTRHDLIELIVIYRISVLHPNVGIDATDSPSTLTDDQLIMLVVSDDYRYITKKEWKEEFDDNEYLEFEFPDITIPSGATINSVLLKFEWQRPNTVDDAQLKIYVGSNPIASISLKPLPDASVDRNETIDLMSYGIDTVDEINNLKIRFQATDGRGAKTQHDWIEIQVTYTVTIFPEIVWSDGVIATWTLSNMKPGDSVSGQVLLYNVGTIAADHVKIHCNYTVEEENPRVESDTDPYTDQNPDAMAKAIIIVSAYYSGNNYEIDLLEGKNTITGETHDTWKIDDIDGDGKITLYDLHNDPLDDLPPPNGLQYSFTMTLQFDPNAGNDFQGDTLYLTMIFTLNQVADQ